MKKTIALAAATTLLGGLVAVVPASDAGAVSQRPSAHLHLPGASVPGVAYAIHDQAGDATARQAAARVVSAKASEPAWVAAINWAQTRLGVKYVWGGDSMREGGYDCSGLTMRAFQKAGISIPRVASDQYRAAKIHPKRTQLLPGDLVFYKNRTGIHHVGLYVGSQMMIHAPRTGTVIRFNKINYMSGYYGAARFS